MLIEMKKENKQAVCINQLKDGYKIGQKRVILITGRRKKQKDDRKHYLKMCGNGYPAYQSTLCLEIMSYKINNLEVTIYSRYYSLHIFACFLLVNARLQ